MDNLSPMMKQYLEMKDKNKDAILFFRLGDFYEMFFDDAELVSRELDITLTGRDCGLKEKAPMCGVPYHSSEAYIARLIEKGYKVAICEQMENPMEAKGIVKRDIVRIVTPGTVIEDSMLDESKNNYICSVFIEDSGIGLCFCDISTGELNVTDIENDENKSHLKNELARFSPREILLGGKVSDIKPLTNFINEKLSSSVETPDNTEFSEKNCLAILDDYFNKNFASKIRDLNNIRITKCVGALLSYLKDTQKNGLERISVLNCYEKSQYMQLDSNTIRNLELIETMRTKQKKGSLLDVLDKTKTSMGKRLIRSWVERPLLSIVQICKRQDAVEELLNNLITLDSIRDELSYVHDVERLMTKMVYGSANCRDLKSLSSALMRTPKIRKELENSTSCLLREIYINMDELSDVCKLIENAIVDDPPVSVREGGMIKSGFNEEIDRVLSDMKGSKELIASIEQREKEKTNIPKLKIGYNRVFGYYIEITNSYKNLVPADYIRKQTLSGCERYITEELKSVESRVLGAKDKAVFLEFSAFEEIRNTVASNLLRIQSTAKMLSLLDVLCSLSNVAYTNQYSRPKVDDSGKIMLTNSRHPVVEKLLKDSMFVSNDVLLDSDKNRVSIITGPNMAGKSTYMRQTALIVLMAQIGSFVPASYAEIGIVDSIFTRVGASDDLASGQSTFMVEMNEVALILESATRNSLLILDEIGRGTSTFDGMSIARAVLEFVTSKEKLGAKTLFATHYHELTGLEHEMSGIKNYNIAVKKRGDDITFLRKIVPGGADDSYGIEVAKLAGIPVSVIKRAKEILKELETDKGYVKPKEERYEESQNINIREYTLIEKIKKIDVETLTPIEALNELFKISKMVKGM